MKVTYDQEANASYIYFTSIGVGGVKETVTYQKLDVDLDKQKQIIAFRLFESDGCAFRERLTYVLTHPEATYDQVRGSVQISFVESLVERRIPWDANVDLDSKGQIVGLEILFPDSESAGTDGQELFPVAGKLEHISRFLVPFHQLH